MDAEELEKTMFELVQHIENFKIGEETRQAAEQFCAKHLLESPSIVMSVRDLWDDQTKEHYDDLLRQSQCDDNTLYILDCYPSDNASGCTFIFYKGVATTFGTKRTHRKIIYNIMKGNYER